MQKLQDSVFNLVKTTNLSPAVFSFLQPTDDSGDKTPLGGILKDTKHGWLALGPKFCVVDLRTGMKVAAHTFGATLSNNTIVTSVVELPTPLTENSQQLIISLQCDDISIIVVLNINGSQILRCIQTDVVVTELTVCDKAPDGIFGCFDGIVIAGTKRGEIFAFDLNRATLIQALKDISQGYEHLIHNELNPTNLSFLPLDAVHRIEEQRELALENDHHLAVLLNENSFMDGQYIFRNPDGTVRMKAKRDHVRVTVLEYIPQMGSVAVGFNFGAFQIWNLMALDLEFTSQVNVECLPVTHFGFQEPCDDPRAFCYLWVIFSVIDRYEEEEFPLAVMYSLTYQGKRMLSDTKCLYQDFTSATIRFQVELSTVNDAPLLGGKCISCHTYSIKSTLGDEGEDNMLNLCQLVWECWAENTNSPMQYGMLLFDLDQWYKDQMPSTYRVESNAFLSASSWSEMSGGSGSVALHARLDPASVTPYTHATRLEEHFYPNSLQYNCICLNTSEVCVLSTAGIQRQIIGSMDEVGPTVLLHPPRLYAACVGCGLAPLYATNSVHSPEDQRRYLLSVALEARLARFLKRCAHDWATGSHSGVGCTLPFLVDWCWKRAIELKENAKELTAPLFISSALPDRNIVRCLEHCVQQLTQLTGLMDAILTKCCNLVVPDALSEMEEKHKGIGTVSLYFQVVQWFLRVGLLPERVDGSEALPYPAVQLYAIYNKRRLKLNRIQENGNNEENSAHKSCTLLYIDQLLEQEFGGDRIHQMWIKGGSECCGLYPPPSLYALLRLYLLPDIAEEHKHSLVLYLLVDYSMIYDDVRYETVIRRLMQFPTMFGLSNTAIKATQAFWHLDHRDFDFALDQLQCLTGNTLSEWQHNVVLSSLLAQKKTQAALQYLHVRKPAPIQNTKDGDYKVNDYDKLDDWHSCCNLYLARGLVYEALDVIRMCVQNADNINDKMQVLNMFFKGCRNTGNLSKILSVSFSSFEEEAFIKYLENCNEPQASNILIMYYLQQSRYLEAERYNTKLRHTKPKSKDLNTSIESLFDSTDREGARDNLVEAMCAALPDIVETVAHCAFDQRDVEWHIHAPKPMSFYVQAKSPKNRFTYKSSFIQDTIQNASETWVNRPKIRKGLKRMLNIEETPFICTPKLSRSRSVFTDTHADGTPPKRARLNLTGTPRTPRSAFKVNEKMSSQMEKLLDMPEIQSPVGRIYERPETPHSILKSRRSSRCEAPSPSGSRYLDDTDDELEMETASNHTHYSDSTNKHLRFTIPTPTELCTEPTPSPILSRKMPSFELPIERERSASTELEKEMDVSTAESYVTTASHAMNESNPLESPPKKLATEANVAIKKAYKDSVRARRSLSISANSSLSDDPNTSIESIADIPITLINPRYSGTRRRSQSTESRVLDKDENTETQEKFRHVGGKPGVSTESSVETKYTEKTEIERDVDRLEVPKTPRGRRGLRASSESTPLRSGSGTPERQNSPAVTPMRASRISRSRSKTPELSPRTSPLPPIMEQPKEAESELHAERSMLSVPRSLRSRSRTPERLDKGVSESPKLEAIKESPTKSDNESPPPSPSRRNLRNRSRTPEVEVILEPVTKPSSRSLRSRSKTPEKLMSPKKEHSVRSKKSLSRLVLEANTFAKTKHTLELLEAESASESKPSTNEPKEVDIQCTPMKPSKQVTSLMDVTLSPITNKSILQSSNDSFLSESADKQPKDADNTDVSLIPLPNFAPLQETYFEKSVLRSYQSSVGESSQSTEEREVITETRVDLIPLPAFTTIHEDFGRSVLHSCESSVADTSSMQETPIKDAMSSKAVETPINTDFSSVLHSRQSSLAESTQPLNASSLITDDSDVEMRETENQESTGQKEEQIAEIAREVHEIDDDSDDNESEEESSEDESSSLRLETDEVLQESEDSFGSNAAKDRNTIQVGSDYSSKSSGSSPIPTDYNKPSLTSQEMVDRIMETHDTSGKPMRKSTDSNDSSSSKFREGQTDSNSSSTDNKSVESDSDESDDSSQSKKVESDSCESEDSNQVVEKLDATGLPKSIASARNKGDNIPAKMSVTLDQAQISIMTDDNSMVVTDSDVTVTVEDTNPLDQAQVSLMTDDNSTVDNIEMTESIVNETNKDKQVTETLKSDSKIEPERKIQTETLEGKPESKDDAPQKESSDSSDTSESDHELSLNYSDDKIESENEITEKIDDDIIRNIPMPIEVPTSSKGLDVVDTSASETEIKTPDTIKENYDMVISQSKPSTKFETEQKSDITSKPEADKETTIENMNVTETSEQRTTKQTRLRERVKSTSSNTDTQPNEMDEPKTPVTRKRAQSRAKSTELTTLKEDTETKETSLSSNSETLKVTEPKTATRKRTQSRTKSTEIEIPKETDKPKTPITRKRTTKSSKTDEPFTSKIELDDTKEEPKTPITRKRAQSTNQSEETTPENVTPSRRKTPTSGEVRKIITRRMSREMKLDESNKSLDESITPKRRSARKNTDDNESVASGSSMASSVQSGEGKSRRGRKSTVATKPDLSVIPEAIAEDRDQSRLDVIQEYSGARKITRHQKAILEKSRGLSSIASRASRSSVSEQDEDERQPAFDLQPIDRISLLNKESYDGPPDEDEMQLRSMSPDSIASDASRMRSRMSKETKVVKAAKIHRRIASLDVPESPTGSPALSGADSPARNRRASFTRAIEALHTPKGKRLSTDSRRSDAGSPVDSPATSEHDAPTTPSRRGRRASSQSNTSTTGRTRSKKMPVLEEIKETKK